MTRRGAVGEGSSVEEAVGFLAPRIGTPRTLVVLGSGAGDVVREIEDGLRIPFEDVPGYPGTGVEGHSGAYVAGRLAGREVLVQAGRFHLYEGYAPERLGLPIRVAARLGVGTVLLTNAAGGIDRRLRPGDLVLLDDHINLMWRNPLIGPVESGEPRFPDMSEPYDRELQALARSVALELAIPLQSGVYAAVPGPSYETPAEVRALARAGADLVGMSTVPEVLVARSLGLRCLAVSLVSNPAAGLSDRPLTHDEIVEVGRAAASKLAALIRGIVGALP